MGAVIAAVGPVFGGWLIDVVGWRSIFLINLPPAIGVDAAQINLDRYLPLGAVGHFGSLGQRPHTSGLHLHVRDTAYRIFAAACG